MSSAQIAFEVKVADFQHAVIGWVQDRSVHTERRVDAARVELVNAAMHAELFAVFKAAVFRHECGGVFASAQFASAVAHRLIRGERDDHHWYEVVPFKLGAITEQTPIGGDEYERTGGDLVEPAEILQLTRSGGVVTEVRP